MTCDALCREITRATGCVVVSLDYRLAPEMRFPALVDDTWDAWVAIAAGDVGTGGDVDNGPVAIGGMSAGGNLATVAWLMARDAGGPGIADQLLVVPVCDSDLTRRSYQDNAVGVGLETGGAGRRGAPVTAPPGGGPMTELGSVKRAYVFQQVAVLVFGWHEADPGHDEEHGVRVEVRLRSDPGYRGSPSAAQVVEIDQPLWRADLFDLITAEPGTFLRAHYHPSFEGVEPSERHWDEHLAAEPFRWLAAQLSDLEAIVKGAGAADMVDPLALAQDAAALRELVDEVVAAATSVSAQIRDA